MATSSAPQSKLHRDSKPHRQWRDIAKEASEEYDPIKALQLAQELIRALDAESRKHMEHVAPDQNRITGFAILLVLNHFLTLTDNSAWRQV